MAKLSAFLGRNRAFFYAAVIFASLIPSSFVRAPIGMDHLASTINAFEYFYGNGFQFGKDVLDNVGPYGFLHYPSVYSGKSFYARTISFLAVTAAFSFLGAAFLSRLKSLPAQLASLAFLIYFPFQENFPMLSFEIVPRLSVFLSGVYLLDNMDKPQRSPRLLAAVCAISLFYAYITLQKTSNMFYIVFVISSVSIYYILNKKRLLPAVLAGSFVVFLLSLWILAGQRAAFLPNFFLSSYRFSATYQEVASDLSSRADYIFGLATLTFAAGFAAFRLARAAMSGRQALIREAFYASAYSSGVFFAWKHGMVTSGIHAGIYFNYAACVAPYLFFHRADELKTDKPISEWKIFRFASFANIGIAVFSAALFIGFLKNPDLARPRPFDIYSEAAERAKTLERYKFGAKKTGLDWDIFVLARSNKLPESLRQYIGNAKVDEYGNEPQLLLINNMNYRPRPVAINYVAQNAPFMEINKEYFSGCASAPRFVFWDENLFAEGSASPPFGVQISDSGVFLELLYKYRPIDKYQKWLILERNNSLVAPEFEFLGAAKSKFNRRVGVPYAGRDLYWCKIDIRYNLLGRLVKFLFKPSKISIEYYDDGGRGYEQRITPIAAEYGFLINPLINNAGPLIDFYNDAGVLPHVKSIGVKYMQGISERFFEEEVVFKFYRIKSAAQPCPEKSS